MDHLLKSQAQSKSEELCRFKKHRFLNGHEKRMAAQCTATFCTLPAKPNQLVAINLGIAFCFITGTLVLMIGNQWYLI